MGDFTSPQEARQIHEQFHPILFDFYSRVQYATEVQDEQERRMALATLKQEWKENLSADFFVNLEKVREGGLIDEADQMMNMYDNLFDDLQLNNAANQNAQQQQGGRKKHKRGKGRKTRKYRNKKRLTRKRPRPM